VVCGSNSTPAQREETRSGGFIISALPVIVLLLLHAVQVNAGAVSGLSLFFVCGLIPLTGGASERKVTPWSTVSLTRTLTLGACCSFYSFSSSSLSTFVPDSKHCRGYSDVSVGGIADS